jgi:putative phosphoesterase
MRLAILSDIHDEQEHLQSVLGHLAFLKPDALILCGDLTAPAILEQCHAAFTPLAFCLGNCDRSRADALMEDAGLLGAAAWDSVGVFPLPEGGSVAFAHFPHLARRAALTGRHSAVFYGHTHRVAEERLRLEDGSSVLLANPGDVQGRYGRVGGLLWDSSDSACMFFRV